MRTLASTRVDATQDCGGRASLLSWPRKALLIDEDVLSRELHPRPDWNVSECFRRNAKTVQCRWSIRFSDEKYGDGLCYGNMTARLRRAVQAARPFLDSPGKVGRDSSVGRVSVSDDVRAPGVVVPPQAATTSTAVITVANRVALTMGLLTGTASGAWRTWCPRDRDTGSRARSASRP